MRLALWTSATVPVPSGFEDVTDVTGCNQPNKFVEILQSERERGD